MPYHRPGIFMRSDSRDVIEVVVCNYSEISEEYALA